MPFFAASISTDDVLVQWQGLSDSARNGLIIFGALILVVGLSIVWVVFIRKPKRRHNKNSRHSSHGRPRHSSEVREADGESSGQRRRKWRRPRREHRPRNPTLAETGGLPPPRTPDPSDSQF